MTKFRMITKEIKCSVWEFSKSKYVADDQYKKEVHMTNIYTYENMIVSVDQ